MSHTLIFISGHSVPMCKTSIRLLLLIHPAFKTFD